MKRFLDILKKFSEVAWRFVPVLILILLVINLIYLLDLKSEIIHIVKSEATEAKMRKEPQFDIQMEMNKKVKVLRKELEELKNQLNKLT